MGPIPSISGSEEHLCKLSLFVDGQIPSIDYQFLSEQQKDKFQLLDSLHNFLDWLTALLKLSELSKEREGVCNKVRGCYPIGGALWGGTKERLIGSTYFGVGLL